MSDPRLENLAVRLGPGGPAEQVADAVLGPLRSNFALVTVVLVSESGGALAIDIAIRGGTCRDEGCRLATEAIARRIEPALATAVREAAVEGTDVVIPIGPADKPRGQA